MPRKNRYHIPGMVWHITHRCHDQKFLLKFKRDRLRYRHWLFEARRRYGFCVLNYMLTSNHVHLIVLDEDHPEVIIRSMQLIQGRMAQEYNRRNKRVGAFWQDRFHGTPVQSGKHLSRCMTYVDLNMVRAGFVRHPSEWTTCGYHEIQNPRSRYRVINLQKAAERLHLGGLQELQEWQNAQISSRLSSPRPLLRESIWTESVAVGEKDFVDHVQQSLGTRGRFKQVEAHAEGMVLKEDSSLKADNFSCYLRLSQK